MSTQSPETNVPLLESMNVGMLLDKAIHLYSRNFGLLIMIYSIPFAVSVAAAEVIRAGPDASAASGTALLRFLVVMVIDVIIGGIAGGAMTVVVSSRYLGADISFLQAYRAALRKGAALAGCACLSGLLIFLGFMGLLVPGIFLALCYFLVSPIIMLEDIPAVRSLKRSRLLSRGYRWRTLLLLLVSYTPVVLISILVPALITVLTHATSGPAAAVSRLVPSAVSLFVGPFLSILSILIYYNQRIRKEGFDLAFLAQAMSQQRQ